MLDYHAWFACSLFFKLVYTLAVRATASLLSISGSLNLVKAYSAAQQKSRFFSKLACRLVFNCR